MPNSLDQLLFVSQEQGRDLHFYPDNPYFFDDSAGEDIPVYIVDTGATIDNTVSRGPGLSPPACACMLMSTNNHTQEFTQGDNIASKIQWIFVGTDEDGTNSEDDSSIPKGGYGPGKAHGTAMLSLVTGATVGVSKRVQPVLVRVPRRQPSGGGTKPEDWLEGVSKVNDVFTTQSTVSRAVLLMAFYYPRTTFMIGDVDYSLGFRTRMAALLQSLAQKGVVLVTGTGNLGQVNNTRPCFAHRVPQVGGGLTCP